jgi:hypothetical protein
MTDSPAQKDAVPAATANDATVSLVNGALLNFIVNPSTLFG